jgi:hypothetical protein
MTIFQQLLLVTGVGIVTVTLIDVLGSITSRKLSYPYKHLTVISFIVYTYIGYYISRIAGLESALMVGSVVGIYDGTIGWKLAIILEANMGAQKEEALKMTTMSRILLMIGFSSVFGSLGYFLG